MSASPIAMRIIASSILIASRAGTIIRDVMTTGELGIVEKVSKSFADDSIQYEKWFNLTGKG